mgnify:CR=1 FL=1
MYRSQFFSEFVPVWCRCHYTTHDFDFVFVRIQSRDVLRALSYVVGFVLNAAGVMGAGDAKFAADAAPFVALGDWQLLMWVFAACIFAGFVTCELTF